eukprot:1549140-Lingulodinium_polyedra.AAC.1
MAFLESLETLWEGSGITHIDRPNWFQRYQMGHHPMLPWSRHTVRVGMASNCPGPGGAAGAAGAPGTAGAPGAAGWGRKCCNPFPVECRSWLSRP